MAISGTAHAQNLAYFGYVPNRGLAVAGLCCFLLVAAISAFQNTRTRAWFMFIVTAVALLEAAGYVARLRMLTSPGFGTYVAMQLFLIITPTLLALVDYLIVGRLIRLSSMSQICQQLFRPHKPSSPCYVYDFIDKFAQDKSDAVTLFIQCAGGGLLAMTNPAVVNIGAKIELAGLILQLCFFAIFACITIHIHNSHRFGLSQRPGSRMMFACLYASMILLTIRNVYRAVEFAQGFQGYLAGHEKYFYIFDTLMVALCALVMSLLHPGYILPKVSGGASPSLSTQLVTTGTHVNPIYVAP